MMSTPKARLSLSTGHATRTGERSFTLIELIIVLSIIGLLVGLALPTYKSATVKARETVLKENLFILRKLLEQYAQDKGKYPDSLQTLVQESYLRSIWTPARRLHEGQIALWQAIRHYDAGRGVAFSTYAVPAIRHRLWAVVAQAQRPQGAQALPAAADPATAAAQAWQRQAVRTALRELLACLPDRSYHIIVAAYGLEGQPPLSLAAIGRLYGLSRERVRQIRNDALVLLRLPALSGCGGCVTRPTAPPTSGPTP